MTRTIGTLRERNCSVPVVPRSAMLLHCPKLETSPRTMKHTWPQTAYHDEFSTGVSEPGL
ncbi:hypothetical protein BAUCODRAFT_29253 [Baudoinia panamericana UAMH 10762]|uniref:Uncharacterized protein n=1 Tax=Baudoinia panamericana (strain UAMH 10762) TaxID=717646 RepID=M2MV88_BAUPA|nr:uncharacterized protein BAUCODRAFT_29253 [Baudoinia panamericana UAMH 10762]EMD00872.1 hypothetical protein BAUCODRAFT_29253 [Baudoinia panamericana UAMH 10762]